MSQVLPMVYLVRHGETAWTLTAQHTGRTDLPLNDQGERQAREVGTRLTELRIDRILSSPLKRARRTAELAMPHSRIEADDDLMEWDYGAYEGRRTVDIEVERPGWRLFREAAPVVAKHSIPSVGVRAVSSAAFAHTAAMCSSSVIVKFFAFLPCIGSGSHHQKDAAWCSPPLP